MRYQSYSLGAVTLEKKMTTHIGEDIEKLERSHTAHGTCKDAAALENILTVAQTVRPQYRHGRDEAWKPCAKSEAGHKGSPCYLCHRYELPASANADRQKVDWSLGSWGAGVHKHRAPGLPGSQTDQVWPLAVDRIQRQRDKWR